MKLNKTIVKKAEHKPKNYKLADAMGLYLFVTQKGKYWRFDYRYAKKRKTLALGVYPDISLDNARDALYHARKALRDGFDPSLQRKIVKSMKSTSAENSFKAIALEWLAKQTWVERHYKTVEGRFHNHIFPHIGSRPISEITISEMMIILNQIEDKGIYETAHRVRGLCSQVFEYAIRTDRAENDPAVHLRKALKPVSVTNFAAITDPIEVGGLLRAIEEYTGNFVTQSALSLAPYVFLRPGELRYAEWKEFNFETNEWIIPAIRMKKKRIHIVPLTQQMLEILFKLRKLTGEEKFLFPSIRSKDRPLSENTINGALRRLGYTKEEMTGHGFRATASTLLHDSGKYKSDWIEMQLSHSEKNTAKKPYNRAQYLTHRKKMMQEYSDYLCFLRDGADVIQITQSN